MATFLARLGRGSLNEADVGLGSTTSSSGGATFVTVMQTAYLRERHDLACAGRLDRSGVRRVLTEREVRACAVVVGEVRLEDRMQVGLAEDDDVVKAVAANGAHEALHEGILS
jgi:hypothetical protein